MRLQELREQRNQIVAGLRKLVDDNPGEKWTPETQAEYDARLADIDRLDAEYTRQERIAEVSAATTAVVAQRADREGTSLQTAEDKEAREMSAFLAWARYGIAAMPEDLRPIAQQRLGHIQGAQSTSTTAGGYTIPAAFYAQLEQALKFFGGMRQVATVIQTAGGQDLPMPTVNDTAQVGAILSENTQVAAQDVTFGQVVLKSYVYSSKLVLVSLQLLQDSAFDIGALLANLLGERLGRIQNTHFTTGTGSSQPNGIVTASASGKVGTTGQTATVIFDDLVDLIHSIDPLYRQNNCRFMMNDASLKVVRKLKDSQNRPIFLPGYGDVTQSFGDTLLGYPITVNNDVATMAANAKSILFGRLDKYFVREVLGIQVVQMRERYADYLQVGFHAFNRCDGNLLDAGTNPVKYYANSAT